MHVWRCIVLPGPETTLAVLAPLSAQRSCLLLRVWQARSLHMGRRSFTQRSETFGLESGDGWAMDAFRLLFNVPRSYQPLVDAWELRFPGTKRALQRLVSAGFVAYQPPIVVDTRTGQLTPRTSRKLDRYLITAAGRRLLDEAAEDLRNVEDRFPRTADYNVRGVVKLLKAFDLDGSHARYGLSVPHAALACALPERNVRWWAAQFKAQKLIRQLDAQYADAREVVPAHWRATRMLCRQLSEVLENVDGAPGHLVNEFRLRRTRFLADIEPARLGVSGATDFDHDVTVQQVLAAMLRSPRCAPEGIFTVEPRFAVPTDTAAVPWRFQRDGDDVVFYQPDAELRERDDSGVRRSVLEYERYQSRRAAWSHVERFLGLLHTSAFPGETAVLRFVVDTDARVRSYVELIEAFADYALYHPERMPANPVTLAVSSVGRVCDAADGLDLRTWFRISLPSAAEGEALRPVLHAPKVSPYGEYFTRS